jgi:hypothetical protein
MTKRRSVRANVRARIESNRQRVTNAREQEEREAAAIRELNQSKPERQDIVAEMCASVLRVYRVDN